MSSDKNFNKYFTNNNMMDYFEIDIETNNSTQQQIQSMNSLQIPDCATTSRMEGEPIATRKEAKCATSCTLRRRATRSPILSIQNNSLKPEPWRKPEG